MLRFTGEGVSDWPYMKISGLLVIKSLNSGLVFNLALILPPPFHHVNLKKVVSVVVEGISELTIGFIRISFMQLLLFNFVGIVNT